MKKYIFKVFLHILAGLIFGCCATMMYLSSSESFYRAAEAKIAKQFYLDYGCKISCKLEKIQWFSLRATLSSIQIFADQPKHTKQSIATLKNKETNKNINDEAINEEDATKPDWSILAEKLIVKASWFNLLFRHILKISLSFEHVIMLETFEVEPHSLPQFCSKLFAQGQSSFIIYDDVSISDGLLYLKRTLNDLHIQIPFSSHLSRDAGSTKLQAYIVDGSLICKDLTFVRNVTGQLTALLPDVSTFQKISGQLQLNYVAASNIHEGAGFIAGKIEQGAGSFVIKSEDGSIVIDPVKIECLPNACLCSANMSTSCALVKYFDLPDIASALGGSIILNASADLYNFFNTLQMSILLGDLSYKTNKLLPEGKITVHHHDSTGLSGVLSFGTSSLLQVDIALHGDQKKITLTNVVDLTPPQCGNWTFKEGGISLVALLEKNGDIAASYQLEAYNSGLDEYKKIAGSFLAAGNAIIIDGEAQAVKYKASALLYPEIILQSFVAISNGVEVANFKSNESKPEHIFGEIDFSLLHDLISEPFKISFAQNGTMHFSGSISEGVFTAHLHTSNAHMRIPTLYNVIQSITASIQVHVSDKKIIINNVAVEWYEGSMHCKKATLLLDNAYNCRFVHAPIILDGLMFSWDRGIYLLLSGRLLCLKKNIHDSLLLDGKFMISKSELKENLFALEFQELLSGVSHGKNNAESSLLNCQYDFSIFTKEPLSITTSFLSAQAIVDLSILGTTQKPELTGEIRLVSGAFNFPYKPLEITYGKLRFTPEQPLDPLFDIVAKGKLKRFGVTMQAWGSALDPHVLFEAQPFLSEDQIMSLLLLGIENNSLGMMVPVFLTQKLQEIIFGPALSNTKLKTVFDKLLKSLRYVRFLPEFTNQAGRGGMRGTIEIDASEHLQAKIDTNFMHIEDTKFDIDYAATDDVTLRLQKDGPSTYGGEVEFRWKFG